MNIFKKEIGFVSIILIFLLTIATATSGAWFTSEKHGFATVEMAPAVSLVLGNNAGGDEDWVVVSSQNSYAGDVFTKQINLTTLSNTPSIIRVRWEFLLYDPDDELVDEDYINSMSNLSLKAKIENVYNYYSTENATNIGAITDNSAPYYFIYKEQQVYNTVLGSNETIGWYYYNQKSNIAQQISFTSSDVLIWSGIDDDFAGYTIMLKFIAQSIQSDNINESNFNSAGWGEWTDLPVEVQNLLQ